MTDGVFKKCFGRQQGIEPDGDHSSKRCANRVRVLTFNLGGLHHGGFIFRRVQALHDLEFGDTLTVDLQRFKALGLLARQVRVQIFGRAGNRGNLLGVVAAA